MVREAKVALTVSWRLVMLGPCAAILDRELDRVINVEDDDHEQERPDDPEERAELAQLLGVAVDPLRSEENLQIAEEMADDEQNQDQPGHRHDHFPANGGAMKGGYGGHKVASRRPDNGN